MLLRKGTFILAVAIAASTADDKICRGGTKCITVDSCPGVMNGLIQRNTLILQLLQKLHCGFESYDKPKICCPPEFQTNIVMDFRRGEDMSASRVGEDMSAVSLLPTFEECGKQNNYRLYRQVRTEIDEHPWTALLGYVKPNDWEFHCGGVLISSRYVLTAASCVNGPDLPSNWNLAYVRLGEWNITSNNDCDSGVCSSPHVDVDIEKFIVHENYTTNDNNQQNDIALLRLARDVPFTKFIKPICLPSTEELKNKTFESYELEVAGWGETGSRSASDVKLKTRVVVVDEKMCSQSYQWIGMQVSEKQMCAVAKRGQKALLHRRDSGSGLVGRVASEGNWVAVGLASYGPMFYGAATKWPSVYTRVGPYVDWIVNNMKP